MVKIRLAIIGSGNVGWYLSRLFAAQPFEVWQVCRNGPNEQVDSVQIVRDTFQLPQDLDYYLICVADQAIQQVGQGLQAVSGIVAHSSGFMGIESLAMCKRPAVFYPFQTITKGKALEPASVPILLEAKNEIDLHKLEILASNALLKTWRFSSDQRKKLHLAGVFANNFVNHILFKAEEVLMKTSAPAALLQPLIRETIAKAYALGPKDAQTGPARRNDILTMHGHLQLLSDFDKNLYENISQSIQRLYER
jgi:predicted short-subunit dehydrogenase-like oxidoreductase (DUF2520 family)